MFSCFLADKVANEELFTPEAGAREGVKKLLFLITDGRQNPRIWNGMDLSPAQHSKPLHEKKIKIYAVGIGKVVRIQELQDITREPKNVYTVNNFEQLLDESFIDTVSAESCSHPVTERKLFFLCADFCSKGKCSQAQ